MGDVIFLPAALLRHISDRAQCLEQADQRRLGKPDVAMQFGNRAAAIAIDERQHLQRANHGSDRLEGRHPASLYSTLIPAFSMTSFQRGTSSARRVRSASGPVPVTV